MRILITNDDGIGAPGIIALARWAAKLGKVYGRAVIPSPHGEVAKFFDYEN